MNKLILILLIAFSFGADWSAFQEKYKDWWKGKKNPNGQTLALTYTTSDFIGIISDGNSNVNSSELVIPLTDFFTITQQREYVQVGDDNFNPTDGIRNAKWLGGRPTTQISFHLPINWD